METLLTRALLLIAFTGGAIWLAWLVKLTLSAVQGGLGQ